MLAVISDLHLTDGTTGAVISPGAFRLFAERLQDLAIRASWRTDGHYRPIECLDLVLLGDVLDLIHSAHWIGSGARPWDDVRSPQVMKTVSTIVDEVLARNREGLAVLRSLSSQGAIRVPEATAVGEPIHGGPGLPVAVRTFYMVGNRDWLFHVAGEGYDGVRRKVAQTIGLANVKDAPFPHDPYECDDLLNVLRRHRVFARHGDIFDPINFGEDRDGSSLGDAIVIELIDRFAAEIEGELDGQLPPAVVAGLRELSHIRPILLVPVWIEGLLERSGVRPALRKIVKRTWDKLADDLLQLPLVREHDAWSPFELVDGLERALKFSKRPSTGWAGRIVTWLQILRGAADNSYHRHALAEQDFRNRRARHLVYGHTHHAESVPLDASYADGYVLNQTYFNCGTWRRVYRPTQWAAAEHEFIPTECMAFLAFFHGDERGGRPFESWSGTLAAGAVDVTVHRLDAGRANHASEQSNPAPKVPLRPPHFPCSTSASRSFACDRI